MKKSCSYSLSYIFLREQIKNSVKWKCCHDNNFCQNLQKIAEMLCWTFMKILWKYDKKLPSCFHKGTNIGRYALKLKKKNGCHGNNYWNFFMNLHLINFLSEINMLYKFGKDRWKIVAVVGLAFRMDGRTLTVSISPFNIVDGE